MSTGLVSNYAKRMARLSAHIFSEVARPTTKKSMKVVDIFAEKPVQKQTDIIYYYPRLDKIGYLMRELYALGLYRDEHLDFKYEMRRLRALRGKVKPKKGQGKRSSQAKIS